MLEDHQSHQKLTWDQAQFSFRFVNNILAGKVREWMRTTKIGPDVRLSEAVPVDENEFLKAHL